MSVKIVIRKGQAVVIYRQILTQYDSRVLYLTPCVYTGIGFFLNFAVLMHVTMNDS